MLTIEIFKNHKANQDTYCNVGVIYGEETEIKQLHKKIGNQRGKVFNICIVDENIIESQEDNLEELLGYLEYNRFTKIREGLYQK